MRILIGTIGTLVFLAAIASIAIISSAFAVSNYRSGLNHGVSGAKCSSV